MKKYIPAIGAAVMVAAFIFFRFYQLEARSTVGWDQMDNAWAAVRILHDHTYPLVGMMAKLNSGIVIGPLYYYLVALFYALFRYDPIASPVLAGCTAVVSLLLLYGVTKRLHGQAAASIAAVLYTFSMTYIVFDRVQWPVNFIPIVSLVILYALYMVCTGKPRYLLLLGAAVGFSFHIHFTSVFYIPIILAAIPFMPRTRQTALYGLYALGILALFLVPVAVYELPRIGREAKGSGLGYIAATNHGFHLRRFFQLSHDAFIEFERALNFRFFRPFVFLVPLIYAALQWMRRRENRYWYVLPYLLSVWILVPWVAFTLYSGEISDYYFSVTQTIAVMVVALVIAEVWRTPHLMVKLAVVMLLGYYAVVNTQLFFRWSGQHALTSARLTAQEHIRNNVPIPFIEGDVSSYMYYMYTALRK